MIDMVFIKREFRNKFILIFNIWDNIRIFGIGGAYFVSKVNQKVYKNNINNNIEIRNNTKKVLKNGFKELNGLQIKIEL